MRQQYQPRYRAYSPPPVRNRRRTYARYPYYDEDDLSDDGYDESEFENNYFQSPRRQWYHGHRDWGDGDEDDEDDDDDDEYGYGYDDSEEEEESGFGEYDYDDFDGEDCYGYRGARGYPRGYRR